MHNLNEDLLRVENITKTYHLGEIDVPVLKGVSFSIKRGEMVALMGASGSGKSTLMNILGCLDRPSSGEYWLDGIAMSGLTPNERALVRTAKLGFVFQSFNLLSRTTAVQNVLMPLDYSPTRPSWRDAKLRAVELLARVGLEERLDHHPSKMSGGQQQRVAIARSLINQPALLLADEPTGNLDSHTSVEILQMFQELNKLGITVLLVTHDSKVSSYAHRTIRIADGLIESDTRNENWHDHGGHGTNGSNGSNGKGNGSNDHGHDLTNGLGEHAAEPWKPKPHVEVGSAAVATRARAGAVVAASAASDVEHSAAASMGRVATLAKPAVDLTASQPEEQIIHSASQAELERLAEPHLHGHLFATLLPTTLRTALGALRRNKMRAALTTLGIIIGIAAVIATVEIGEGVKSANAKTIAGMGANNLQIRSGAANNGGLSFGSGSVLTLTPLDAELIAARCPAVEAVCPLVWSRGMVVYGNRNWPPNNVYGVTPSYLAVRDWEDMAEGSMFTEGDVASANKVCVIGRTLARELFQGKSPVGQTLRLQNVSLRVLGVLTPKGANMAGMDQDDVLLAPWTTIKFRVSGINNNQNQAPAATSSGAGGNQVNSLNKLYPGSTALYPVPSAVQTANTPQPVRVANVDSITAKAVSAERIPEAITQITRVLRERHHLRDEEPDDFNIRDMTEFNNAFTETSNKIGTLIFAIALISLLVGGVGIMNIMLVSVTERTREIGLRMAVGGRSYHILRQFLIEAVVLCVFGGALGIGLGRLVTWIVRLTRYSPTEASMPAVIAAVIVSVVVGVGFGFYPAWKASRLDPIEALRYE